MTRPLAWMGFSCMIGLAAALMYPPALLIGVIFLTAGVCGRKRCFWIAIGLILAAVLYGRYAARMELAETLLGKPLAFRGWICEEAYRNGRTITAAAETEHGKFLLRFSDYQEAWELGDPVAGVLIPEKAEPDGSRFLFSGGILLRGELAKDSPMESPAENHSIWGKISELRLKNIRLLESSDTQAGALLASLALGARRQLPTELENLFIRSGLRHLLTFSGMHLAMISGFVLWLTRKWNRLAGAVLAWTAAGIGVLLSGMGIAALRGFLLLTMLLLSRILEEEPDELTSLALAGMLTAAVCPPAVCSLSFLLSYSSVLGIILFAPYFNRLWNLLWVHFRGAEVSGRMKTIGKGLSAGLGAQLGILPVSVMTWYFIPVLSVPAAFAAGPLAAGAVLSAGLGCLFHAAGLRMLSELSLAVGASCGRAMIKLAEWLGTLRGAAVPVTEWSTIGAFFLIWATVIFCIFSRATRKRRAVQWILGGTFSAVLVGVMMFQQMQTILVETSADSGAVMLCGAGGSVLIENSRNDYERSLANRLVLKSGAAHVTLLIRPKPDDTDSIWMEQLCGAEHTVFLEQDDILLETEILPGVRAKALSADVLMLDSEKWKIVKCFAGYGVCTGLVPEDAAVVVDWKGNLFSPGGKVSVLPDGSAAVRVPVPV